MILPVPNLNLNPTAGGVTVSDWARGRLTEPEPRVSGPTRSLRLSDSESLTLAARSRPAPGRARPAPPARGLPVGPHWADSPEPVRRVTVMGHWHGLPVCRAD